MDSNTIGLPAVTIGPKGSGDWQLFGWPLTQDPGRSQSLPGSETKWLGSAYHQEHQQQPTLPVIGIRSVLQKEKLETS